MRVFGGSGLARRAGALVSLTLLVGVVGCGGTSRSGGSRSGSKPRAPKASVKKALDEAEKYLVDGNRGKAIAACTKAIRLDPGCKQAYVSRGMAYNESNDLDKALADFSKAVKLDPTDNFAYEQRAQVYEKLHDPAKAKADKDKAFELRQKNRDDYRARLKGKKGKI